MRFVITGCANLMILGEIPSYPVAFLMLNLFICLVTKSSFIGLKKKRSLFVLFVSILFILGWALSIYGF
jgi:predicted neutral ceramidase superfamily lipid hydrolase